MCTKVYALMLMLFAVVSVYGQDNVIDEVVWVVGDEAILKSDVEIFAAYYLPVTYKVTGFNSNNYLPRKTS